MCFYCRNKQSAIWTTHVETPAKYIFLNYLRFSNNNICISFDAYVLQKVFTHK